MAAGEYELALKAYYRGAARHGATVDVLSAIGSADLKLGRLGQAEKVLRRAIDVDETFVPAWNNLGVVLMEKGKVPEASRVFKTAFALDSGRSDEIRKNLRLALAKLDNPSYDAPEEATFSLVRRGHGQYLLLTNL
jgi:Flp pilus assembly protein TadD